MLHQKVSLPENSKTYPSLWVSDCGTYRVIRCVDDIQFIVQRYRTPKYRSLSYHSDWQSIQKRWGSGEPFATMPIERPYGGGPQ